MTQVLVSIGVLAALVIVWGSAAGCGSVSNQTKQEMNKKAAVKGQEVRQEVDALQKQADDLRKEVAELQKKINAHEEKEQQQQINQLKKALKDLQKRVEAEEK